MSFFRSAMEIAWDWSRCYYGYQKFKSLRKQDYTRHLLCILYFAFFSNYIRRGDKREDSLEESKVHEKVKKLGLHCIYLARERSLNYLTSIFRHIANERGVSSSLPMTGNDVESIPTYRIWPVSFEKGYIRGLKNYSIRRRWQQRFPGVDSWNTNFRLSRDIAWTSMTEWIFTWQNGGVRYLNRASGLLDWQDVVSDIQRVGGVAKQANGVLIADYGVRIFQHHVVPSAVHQCMALSLKSTYSLL